MLPKEYNPNFVLSPQEEHEFIGQCDNIARSVLGEPRPDAYSDTRKLLLDDGTYVELTRTATRHMNDHINFSLDFQIFTPVELVSQEEDYKVYEGRWSMLVIDLGGMSMHQKSVYASMGVDDVNTVELEIINYVGDNGEEVETGDQPVQYFSSDISAEDQMRVYDMRNILINQ